MAWEIIEEEIMEEVDSYLAKKTSTIELGEYVTNIVRNPLSATPSALEFANSVDLWVREYNRLVGYTEDRLRSGLRKVLEYRQSLNEPKENQ